jgi:hypothetical protein
MPAVSRKKTHRSDVRSIWINILDPDERDGRVDVERTEMLALEDHTLEDQNLLLVRELLLPFRVADCFDLEIDRSGHPRAGRQRDGDPVHIVDCELNLCRAHHECDLVPDPAADELDFRLCECDLGRVVPHGDFGHVSSEETCTISIKGREIPNSIFIITYK